ncbi:MAG TPA: ABC transporter ATP-binding protein [Ktedonobacteraceae bacterium]
MPEAIVTCDNLVKIYKVADLEVVALQGLDLEVAPGEMTAIVGASGSGKSTLLNILSGLDVPSAGRCVVDSNDLTRLNEAQRIAYRRHVVGHVWQQSGRNLLNELSASANIELPQLLGGVKSSKRIRHAEELLELVGLKGAAKKKPNQLSGGEQQRVAIAVAIANEPTLLLADEPTGELDSVTASEIFHLLRSLNQQLGLTIITVTHDVAIAAVMDRTIAIRDGRTSTETIRREEPLETLDGHAARASAIIGLSSETHRESILIDRVGRLQLPKEALEGLDFQGRAEVRILDDHVELWPLEVPAGRGNGELKKNASNIRPV